MSHPGYFFSVFAHQSNSTLVFCKTSVLSFGSVFTSQLSLAAETQRTHHIWSTSCSCVPFAMQSILLDFTWKSPHSDTVGAECNCYVLTLKENSVRKHTKVLFQWTKCCVCENILKSVDQDGEWLLSETVHSHNDQYNMPCLNISDSTHLLFQYRLTTHLAHTQSQVCGSSRTFHSG